MAVWRTTRRQRFRFVMAIEKLWRDGFDPGRSVRAWPGVRG
jgi:hypothetical protein